MYPVKFKCQLKWGTSFVLQIPENTTVAAAKECGSALHLYNQLSCLVCLSVSQRVGRHKAPAALMLHQRLKPWSGSSWNHQSARDLWFVQHDHNSYSGSVLVYKTSGCVFNHDQRPWTKNTIISPTPYCKREVPWRDSKHSWLTHPTVSSLIGRIEAQWKDYCSMSDRTWLSKETLLLSS